MSRSQGFILQRQQLEQQGKSYCRFWLATDKGTQCVTTEAQPVVFFISQGDADKVQALLNAHRITAQLKPLELNTIDHQPTVGVYFSSVRRAYQARSVLSEQGIILYEDDIRLTDRYLMERFIYGSAEFTGREERQNQWIDAKLAPTHFSPTLRLLSLDVECSERGELYSIGLAADDWQCVLMRGRPRRGQPTDSSEQDPDWIEWVDDEAALLRRFVELFNQYDADVIIGWAVITFDWRLIVRRAEMHNVSLSVGRDGSKAVWRDSRQDSHLGFIDIAGRVVIDGIDALKTMTYQFDSFSLEFVAQALLGKGKDTEDVKNRLAIIKHDFIHNKPKLARYNLQDCVLVLEIFAHTRLMDFLILRSQLTGLELDRIGGSVAAFTNLYLPKFHRAGYVAPNRPDDGGLASPGGYVMESIPGLYQHVLVLDFKSLYPSIIRTFKIDPLGLVEGLAHPEQAIPGFKGACFDREKHFLPDIITHLWQQRDEAKKQQDAARSQAIKILMNSFYGVLGSGGCRFYDTRLASSITMRGHQIMQQTAAWIEEQGYKVIYGDTDSTFVWLNGDYDQASARQVGVDLQNLINQRWQQKIADEFQLDSQLDLEFETYFSQFVMPTIRGSEQGSKKRYAGLKQDGEQQQLVFKGLETVRSDWTLLAKEFQTELYQRVFDGQPVSDYIRGLIAKTRAGELDDKLVYKKRLRQPLAKYTRNVPPHVKAARLAELRSADDLEPQSFRRGSYIKYVITTAGAEPLSHVANPLDYEHYIEKQIRPIAQGILPFINVNFSEIISDQLGLFG